MFFQQNSRQVFEPVETHCSWHIFSQLSCVIFICISSSHFFLMYSVFPCLDSCIALYNLEIILLFDLGFINDKNTSINPTFTISVIFLKPNEYFFDGVRRNFSDSHSKSLQITKDKTLPGPLRGSYVSLFVEKNLVLVSCVFWQRQSDLFVSHISTTMQSLLVLATNFRRLCKTNTTGVLESLIFVTESTEAFLLQAIIVYKYQIR